MLIAGEGGPADPQRALKLLKAPRDTVGVKGVLGQVYLEGKLVPRDVQEALNLIDMAGTWDLDARLQVVRLLAANPEARVTHPKHVLYYALEAAELDESGAMTALIELKLSANPQFQDRPGACKLIDGRRARRSIHGTAPVGVPRQLIAARRRRERMPHDRYRYQAKDQG